MNRARFCVLVCNISYAKFVVLKWNANRAARPGSEYGSSELNRAKDSGSDSNQL